MTQALPAVTGSGSTASGKSIREAPFASTGWSLCTCSAGLMPLSLLSTCSKVVTTAPLNAAVLENLPPHLLVQLLEQVVAERDAAVAHGAAVRSQLTMVQTEFKEYKDNRYLVDPPYIAPNAKASAWWRRIEAVLVKWAPRTTKDEWTAHDDVNVATLGEVFYDAAEGCIAFSPTDKQPGTMYLPRIISSALLLYRVCSMFRNIYIKAAGRLEMSTWSAEVVHVATGEAIRFSEYQGADNLYVSNGNSPQKLRVDMLELLNLLCDPNFTHPYEGVVAGSVGPWVSEKKWA